MVRLPGVSCPKDLCLRSHSRDAGGGGSGREDQRESGRDRRRRPFYVRDVYRHGWSRLDTPERALPLSTSWRPPGGFAAYKTIPYRGVRRIDTL